jgi:hypothetical protein
MGSVGDRMCTTTNRRGNTANLAKFEAQPRSLQSGSAMIRATLCAVSCLRRLLAMTRLAKPNDQVSHSERQGLQQAEGCLAWLPRRSHTLSYNLGNG